MVRDGDAAKYTQGCASLPAMRLLAMRGSYATIAFSAVAAEA
jgi:hypothetical protein